MIPLDSKYTPNINRERVVLMVIESYFFINRTNSSVDMKDKMVA